MGDVKNTVASSRDRSIVRRNVSSSCGPSTNHHVRDPARRLSGSFMRQAVPAGGGLDQRAPWSQR
jgi:hypothetical protein